MLIVGFIIGFLVCAIISAFIIGCMAALHAADIESRREKNS